MSKHRLVNCEFIHASSFKVNLSNKAKLLYLMMLTSADDKGFVDTTNDIINALKTNDNEFEKTENILFPLPFNMIEPDSLALIVMSFQCHFSEK